MRARRVLELMLARKRGPHAFSAYEVREALREAGELRRAALARPRAPHEGRVWFVTIQRDEARGVLYGPLPTQLAALKVLPQVRNLAHDVNPGDAAFAAFGTASAPADTTLRGSLNERLADPTLLLAA